MRPGEILPKAAFATVATCASEAFPRFRPLRLFPLAVSDSDPREILAKVAFVTASVGVAMVCGIMGVVLKTNSMEVR